MSEHLAVLTRYYNACSAGDLAELDATLHDDVVHYFLQPNVGSTPVGGREHLGRYWRKVASMISARWVIDHHLEQGDESVIEWTMYWTPAGSTTRQATRGSEWFVFDSGRIREIRSYYNQVVGDSQLDGFGYAERRYSSHGAEASAIHPDAAQFGTSIPQEARS